MSTSTTADKDTVRIGDVIIAVLLLALFIFAYIVAQDWPFRARFFPQLLTIGGMFFSTMKLIGFVLQYRRGRSAAATAEESPEDLEVGNVALISEEEEEDQSLEYVFSSAGGRAWAAALGWVFGFFLMLWLVGVFIAVPVFAFAYLKIAGKAGWIGAGLYAIVSGGILYVAFQRLLSVPMPDGILF